jgi:hypothetical protein
MNTRETCVLAVVLMSVFPFLSPVGRMPEVESSLLEMPEVDTSLLDLMAGSSALTEDGALVISFIKFSATHLSKETRDFEATRMTYFPSNTLVCRE